MRTSDARVAAPVMKVLALAGLMALAGALGGCHGVGGLRMDVPITRAAKVPGGAPAVDVANTSGTVTVVVDASVKEPQIRASTRDGKVPTWVAATLAGDHGRPVLRVLNSDPRAEGAWVNITVTVPECGGLRVRNAGGPVRVDGVSGAIDVEVNNGGPNEVAWIRSATAVDAPVTVRADVGSIVYFAPSGSHGDIRLRSVSGATRVDAPKEKLSRVRSLLGDWTGTLNDGGPAIDIMTGAGDVLVQVGR